MDTRRESVNGMAVLVALADAGSFSRAAERLGITPSAVSKLLQRLERRLGAQLVQRTTRTMQLTEAGQRYVARARAVLDAIDEADRELEGFRAVPRGTLRVSAPSVLGLVRVTPLLAGFRARCPEVRVELELSDRAVDLVEERVDVAIRVTQKPPEGLVARRLFDVPRVLVATPSYLARAGVPRRPGDLARHECLLLAQPQSAAVETWRLRASARGRSQRLVAIRVGGALAINNVLALADAARAGLGIAEVPRYLVEDDLARRALVEVLPRHRPPAREAWALFAPSPLVPLKTRAFVAHLAAAFGERDGAGARSGS
jgi:DNA-binding transcriptional LysR family regulator